MKIQEYCASIIAKVAEFQTEVTGEVYEGLDAETDLSESEWAEQFYAYLGLLEYDD